MPQSKEIFGTRASLQKSTLHRSSIRDPQLPNFPNADEAHAYDANAYDFAPHPRQPLQPRRRRRRSARRPFRRLRWALASLRTMLVRLWLRLPFVRRVSQTAPDDSWSEHWGYGQCGSEHWDDGRGQSGEAQAERIFPPRSRPRERDEERKGQPEGTKGAGSRFIRRR